MQELVGRMRRRRRRFTHLADLKSVTADPEGRLEALSSALTVAHDRDLTCRLVDRRVQLPAGPYVRIETGSCDLLPLPLDHHSLRRRWRKRPKPCAALERDRSVHAREPVRCPDQRLPAAMLPA